MLFVDLDKAFDRVPREVVRWALRKRGVDELLIRTVMALYTKNETVVLRMIYKKHINVPTTPAACSGTGSSVKRSENWSHPIPSIGLRRQTTTTLYTEACIVVRVDAGLIDNFEVKVGY